MAAIAIDKIGHLGRPLCVNDPVIRSHAEHVNGGRLVAQGELVLEGILPQAKNRPSGPAVQSDREIMTAASGRRFNDFFIKISGYEV